MEVQGIDLSYSNGKVNWTKIKQSGTNFVMIRTGYGKEHFKQIDRQFESNYQGAKAMGIPVGTYHYSYAMSVKEAEEEADFCIKLLSGKQFEYPIFIDIEEDRQVKLPRETCCSIVKAFCSKLEKAGYWAGVYSFDSFFGTNLSTDITNRYTTWVARVDGKKPHSCKRYDMWQYSWKGKVCGSSAETDLDVCYRDFPTLIKNAKKNGFGDAKPAPKYTVSASISGLTQSQANTLCDKLEKCGMTVHKEIQK